MKKLFWISSDGQGSMDMGEYEEQTEKAESAALAELLDQCGEDSQRDAIRAGTWRWVTEEEDK